MRALKIVSAQNLTGNRVRSAAGDEIGKIEEVLIDVEYNRIAYAVLSLGPAVAGEERYVAVPIEALDLAADGRTLVLNADRSLLPNAPAFDRKHYPEFTDHHWGSKVYDFWGYRPYWQLDPPRAAAEDVRAAGATRAGDVVIHRRTNSAAWAAIAILLLAIAAGLGYLVYTRGWEPARNTIAASAQAAFSSVEETSRDAATTARVKTALALSKHVSAFDINVDSSQGRVTLRGQVPTEEARELALVIARDTSGVTEVENYLAVDPGTKPNASREGLGQRVADLEIRTMVREKLARDPDLSSKRIDVHVQRGQVTLAGDVDSPVQKSKAEQIAWSVDGVSGVSNQVHAPASMVAAESAEEKLAKRVEFGLYSTRAFDMSQIQIRSRGTTVILGGTVRSQAEKLLADRVAQGVEGVQKIENSLTVVEPIAGTPQSTSPGAGLEGTRPR